jgi:hypothetical protein
MSQNKIDENLTLLFKKRPVTGKLERLEHDVWRKVHAYDLNWQQKIISVFNLPQFQASALACALIFGISLSSTYELELFLNSKTNQNVLDLRIFSANNPYLATNLFGK